MTTVHRWIFDDLAGEQYTVPINPNKMTKFKAPRSIQTKVTTAVNGQALFFEGRRPPQQWQFSGVILHKDHYLALDHWVYEKGRISIIDHYERQISVVLTDFDATPKRSVHFPWRHEYTISGLVFDVDETTSLPDVEPNYSGFENGGTGGSSTPPPNSVEYSFPSPSYTWAMTHSFDHHPIVEMVDGGGYQVFGSVTYPDDTHVVVTFSQPTRGTATLI